MKRSLILSAALLLANSAFALPFNCPSITEIQNSSGLLDRLSVETFITANGVVVTHIDTDQNGRATGFSTQSFASQGKNWFLTAKTPLDDSSNSNDVVLKHAQETVQNAEALIQKWDMEFLEYKSDTLVCAYKDSKNLDDDPTIFAYYSASQDGHPLTKQQLPYLFKQMNQRALK